MNNKSLFAFIGIIIGILVATAVFGICYKSKNDINMGMPSGDRRDPPNMQDGNGTPPDKPDENGGGGPMASANVTYSAANNITENSSLSNETFSSTTKDENAILVDSSAIVTIDNSTVNKTGDSEGGDTSSFYGNNSAILAKGGTEVTINNVNVTTDAVGANGVFSYGGSATTDNLSTDNTTINISDSTITTSKDNSGGIMTTGGGIMNAKNLTITTAGTSSAAIRTDRGGGTVQVDGGTYKTTGQGSPAIYSTADVSVSNANLISTSSEGIIIERKNSVSIDNSTSAQNSIRREKCMYCQQEVENKEALQQHWESTCLYFINCVKCNNNIEVKGYNLHLLFECKYRKEFKQCKRCKEAIPINEYNNHVKTNNCNPVKPGNLSARCPLCHLDIKPQEKGFIQHLVYDKCSKHTRITS